ncbi:protein of unknown function [Micropruina glycogenica]|uniref:Uncharacterized protein n=1 Tax=Micropruina glycogenica TaxID=75385 RepID=A0A2N9JGK9_9ACTN|nr:protein of unknown function [Micropruina glycogenica]
MHVGAQGIGAGPLVFPPQAQPEQRHGPEIPAFAGMTR